MPTSEPLRIMLVRCKVTQRSLFVDTNHNIYSRNELLSWAKRKIPFIIVDENTGEDITRLLLDHEEAAQYPNS